MKVTICNVSIGSWYPRGAARMIQQFAEHSPGYEIQSWVNVLPPSAPRDVVEERYDYTGYCAKPFAMLQARLSGADIAILIDSAFFPIRSIEPLVDFIAQNGYYFCNNGALVGQWASDRCLQRMGVLREEAMTMLEISSYCVGLNFAEGRCVELLHRWCGFASDRLTFPGPHSAPGHGGRNVGFVSQDNRVKGHRHDQTVLSILSHRLGMRNLVERPQFTAYHGSENETTVLVNRGM